MDKEDHLLHAQLSKLLNEVTAFRREVSITSALLKSAALIIVMLLAAIAAKLWS